MTACGSDSISLLHVNDEPARTEVTASALEREREAFDVHTASSATEGLSMLADSDSSFECIVSDCTISEADGFAFLEAVRESHPDLPFVVFTGEGNGHIASEAISAGASDFVEKRTGAEQYTILANRIENLVARHRAERDLRVQQRRRQQLRAITDNAPVVLFALDADGTVMLSEGRALADLDLEPGEIEGQPIFDVTDGSRIEEYIEAAIDGEAVHATEPFGDRVFEAWFQPVGGERAGDPVTIGAAIDVTERHEHQRALELAQSRFRSLTENADFAVLTIDEDNTVQYANDAVESMFGYAPEELIGESTDLIVPDRLERSHEKAVTRYLREGNRHLDWEWTELPAVHRDGREFPVGISFGEYENETTGTRLFTGVLRDISERKRAEEKLLALHDATRELMRAETPTEVATVATEAANEILDLSLNAVHRYDETRNQLVPMALSPAARDLFGDPPALDVEGTIAGEVFRTGDFQHYDDVRRSPHAANGNTPIRSELVLSLGDQGIFIASSTTIGAIDETDLVLANVLAASVEVALDRADHEALLHEREQQLQRERDSLAALFESVPDPIYRHTFENGNGTVVPQAVNPAFERVFGYDEADVIDRPITETIVPPDLIEHHETLVETSSAGGSLDAEVERRTTTGRRTFLLRNAPIDAPAADGNGEYAIYTDITERRRIEEYRKRLYEVLADGGASGTERIEELLALGSDRLGVETGFLTRLDGEELEIVAACGPDERIRSGATCPLSQAYCKRTVETDEPFTLQHATRSGWTDDPAYEAFGFETYVGSKLVVEGTLYGTVCFADRTPRENDFSAVELAFIDMITRGIASELERRQYEQELERQNERLEEFASVISHDLRNPLGVAQGYLELARETNGSDSFAKVTDALGRMEVIIDDVLTLARQGRTVGATGPVALARPIERAWVNVETANGELLVDDELGTVEADASRLEELFENLFRNAIEHGGQNVRVCVERTPAGFAVSDNGPGIAPEQRTDVFDHGFTTSEDGTGFGLAIVRRIVDAHGWTVTANETASSGGARFEIGF